jgi:hypothetical protein
MANVLAQPKFNQLAAAVVQAGGQAADAKQLNAAMTTMGERMKAFNSVRRQEGRLAMLEGADRAIQPHALERHTQRVPAGLQAFADTIDQLDQVLKAIRPLLTPSLDGVLAQAAAGGPLEAPLRKALTSYGLQDAEVQWLFDECARVNFKLVDLIVHGDPDNAHAMIEAASSGENGLLQCGFLRFTGKPDVDRRVTDIIGRCRAAGVTASHLQVLLICTAATLAAHAHAPNEAAAPGTFAAAFA